jgi:hypothetical protein
VSFSNGQLSGNKQLQKTSYFSPSLSETAHFLSGFHQRSNNESFPVFQFFQQFDVFAVLFFAKTL